VSDGHDLESALQRISQLEAAHEELAERQDETDTSVVRMADAVAQTNDNVSEMKGWLKQLLGHFKLEPRR
jgi:chromosome segregation ATPase